LSVRDSTAGGAFWITATQTGQLEHIASQDVCRVVEWDLGRFFVGAEGTAPPSSEALTHAAIYAADSEVLCVFHVHDPDTWRSAVALALPTIGPSVAYGTVAMADAVAALLSKRRERPLVFATLGHEDGVFSCGGSMDDVGCALVRSLEHALELK
jgi:ribulose-5-phosphate 4-epimerase/fuculose-1-phosphate aldolase